MGLQDALLPYATVGSHRLDEDEKDKALLQNMLQSVKLQTISL